MRKFVFTCGDINGIGPEIVIKTLNRIYRNKNTCIYFVCPSNVFSETIRLIKPKFKYEIVKKLDKSSIAPVQVIDIGNSRITPGKPTAASGKTSFESIKHAFELTSQKLADALITAPISKTAFNLAGISFPGHTELLAEWSCSKNFVMMFLSKNMRAALLTIHHPIKKISQLLTKEHLRKSLDTITLSLKNDLNIPHPRIAVLGLNPHAGENGLIGDEEEKIIKPLIKTFNRNIEGPFSPDAFFASKKYKDFDLILGMYHDQVLIPFKMINFSSGVNFTAGLNIVRTSPDHGVAYDIAWKNRADEGSIFEAYKYARLISFNRKKNEKNKNKTV
ncbi:MAG: 4-hydroxythreonine-4-phosphate dehydrogenase PdxA [Ignavibacteria bacterium RBG_16_34_14]|nr:MAG: 4-hydroxythreonine-4-phosphate dehydrogenase PdxA [Ignavibacteria bacterium RBG_16_34_14]